MQTQPRAARNYWHTHNTSARAISVPLQGCTVPPSGPTAQLQRGMNTHTHRPEDQSHSIIQYKTIYFLHRGSLFVVFSSLRVPLLNHLFFLNILRLDLVSGFFPLIMPFKTEGFILPWKQQKSSLLQKTTVSTIHSAKNKEMHINQSQIMGVDESLRILFHPGHTNIIQSQVLCDWIIYVVSSPHYKKGFARGKEWGRANRWTLRRRKWAGPRGLDASNYSKWAHFL